MLARSLTHSLTPSFIASFNVCFFSRTSDGLSLVIFSTSTKTTVDCVKHYTGALGGALIKKIIVQQTQHKAIPKRILPTEVPLDLLSKEVG